MTSSEHLKQKCVECSSKRSLSPPLESCIPKNMDVRHPQENYLATTSVRQERRALGYTPVSVRLERSDVDVTGIEPTFKKHRITYISAVSDKPKISFSAVQQVSHEMLGMEPYKISFLRQLLLEYYRRKFTYARYFSREQKAVPDTSSASGSLMKVFLRRIMLPPTAMHDFVVKRVIILSKKCMIPQK